MKKRLFITAIDTDMGKTAVGCLIAGGLRQRGICTGVVKPVMTGCPTVVEASSNCSGEKAGQSISCAADDFQLLINAAGAEEGVSASCPYKFEPPVSPHLAARLAGETIKLPHICSQVDQVAANTDIVIIEGAGGVLSPITDGVFMADLAVALDAAAIVVTNAKLGMISVTLCAIEALRNRGVPVVGVVVNRMPCAPDQAEAANPAELEALCGVPVLAVLPAVGQGHAKGVGVSTSASASPDSVEYVVRAIESHPTYDSQWIDRLLVHLEVLAGHNRTRLDTVLRWDADHLWHPFTQMKDYVQEQPNPIVITSGKGCHLQDADGNSYIDGVASLWANVHGHRHPTLDRAISEQLSKVAHSTLLGLTHEPAATFARKLVEIAPPGMERVFYSDDGSTAVEVGLKLALQYWRLREGPNTSRRKFAALTRAYHGDTIGAVSLGGIDLYHAIFRPLIFDTVRIKAPYCYRCPIGPDNNWPSCNMACLAEMERVVNAHRDELAGLVMEPLVQGAAGMITQPPGYLAGVRRICSQAGILLVADEVAVGFGRTGKMFACQHEGVTPDLMAVSKGITGGYLPLAATLTTGKVYEAFLGELSDHKTFYHGHTYTGNPLACAAGLASLKVFRKEGVLDKMAGQEVIWQKGLEEISSLKSVGEIRRRGFMTGIELVADQESRRPFSGDLFMGRRVTLAARKMGAILRPLDDVMVLMPPLAISDGDLQLLLEITRDAIRETVAGV